MLPKLQPQSLPIRKKKNTYGFRYKADYLPHRTRKYKNIRETWKKPAKNIFRNFNSVRPFSLESKKDVHDPMVRYLNTRK